MRKRLIALRLGGGLLVATLGFGIGGALAPTPVKAQGFCEKNLCDNGWFWSSCYASNVSTYCVMYGTWPQEFCYHNDCPVAQ